MDFGKSKNLSMSQEGKITAEAVHICLNEHDYVWLTAFAGMDLYLCYSIASQTLESQAHKLISASFSGIRNKSSSETFQMHTQLIFFCRLKPEWGFEENYTESPSFLHRIIWTGCIFNIIIKLLKKKYRKNKVFINTLVTL